MQPKSPLRCVGQPQARHFLLRLGYLARTRGTLTRMSESLSYWPSNLAFYGTAACPCDRPESSQTPVEPGGTLQNSTSMPTCSDHKTRRKSDVHSALPSTTSRCTSVLRAVVQIVSLLTVKPTFHVPLRPELGGREKVEHQGQSQGNSCPVFMQNLVAGLSSSCC